MLAACQQPAAARGGVELADIFRAYGESYRRDHPLPVSHRKVIEAVERCRTAALGGHIEQCDSCGFERPAYNSCRNLHCLVPAGAVSYDQKRWSPARKNFLFPVTALSVVFCGKFLDLLKTAFARNKLLFIGQTASLANPAAFQLLINALRKKPWIVYAKKPFGSPVQVLDYLGRYTHRVALSNDRILSAHSREVTFSYRDRKNHDRKKTMTLHAHEFIRRFLLHV